MKQKSRATGVKLSLQAESAWLSFGIFCYPWRHLTERTLNHLRMDCWIGWYTFVVNKLRSSCGSRERRWRATNWSREVTLEAESLIIERKMGWNTRDSEWIPQKKQWTMWCNGRLHGNSRWKTVSSIGKVEKVETEGFWRAFSQRSLSCEKRRVNWSLSKSIWFKRWRNVCKVREESSENKRISENKT